MTGLLLGNSAGAHVCGMTGSDPRLALGLCGSSSDEFNICCAVLAEDAAAGAKACIELSGSHEIAMDAVAHPSFAEESAVSGASMYGALLLDDTRFSAESEVWPGSRFYRQLWIVGAAGVLVAPYAGRMADRHGSRRVLSLSLSTLLTAYCCCGAQLRYLLSVVDSSGSARFTGVIVIDAGVQLTQVANQTRIFGLLPNARSRINTVYMVVYFSGAAVGSWISSIAWTRLGWSGVSGLALSFVGLAMLRPMTGIKDDTRENAMLCGKRTSE